MSEPKNGPIPLPLMERDGRRQRGYRGWRADLAGIGALVALAIAFGLFT